MHDHDDFRPPRLVTASLFVGALVGASIVAYATAVWGPGVYEQALHHFTAAEALRHGESMTLSRGQPFSIWPPLLPILLAIVRCLGCDYPTSGLLLNLLAHTTILFVSSMLLLRLFGSTWIAVTNLAVLLVSVDLLRTTTTLQTEPVFLALVITGVYAFVLYLERPTRVRLGVLIVLAALACLQRYMGVALVTAVFFLMLAYPASLAPGRRRIRAVVFAALALTPLLVWVLRCLAVGTRVGGGTGEAESLVENLRGTAHSLGQLVTTGTTVDRPRGILNVAVAIALGVVVLVHFIRVREANERRAMLVYLAFPAVYMPTFLALASIVHIDAVNDRFLMPVYPFLWGSLVLGCAWTFRRLRGRPASLRLIAAAAVAAVFASHLIASAFEMRTVVAEDRTEGTGGLSSPEWAGSPLVGWLRDHPPACAVYSNIPELVLLATGRRARYADAESLPRLLEHAPHDVLVVWMQSAIAPAPFPESAFAIGRCTCVVRMDSAVIYRVAMDR
jgi:hypothetical protein